MRLFAVEVWSASTSRCFYNLYEYALTQPKFAADVKPKLSWGNEDNDEVLLKYCISSVSNEPGLKHPKRHNLLSSYKRCSRYLHQAAEEFFLSPWDSWTHLLRSTSHLISLLPLIKHVWLAHREWTLCWTTENNWPSLIKPTIYLEAAFKSTGD